MVIQASVLRSNDGLPLSASTDMDVRTKNCQKYMKMIARRLDRLPDRCTLHLEGFKVHLTTLSLGLSFMLLCEEDYPTVLAFCFLDDLQREFIDSFGYKKPQEAKRPYTFIEFDLYVQKLKHSYNRPKSLTTRLSLSDMSAELRLKPPHDITEDDLGLVDNSILKPCKDTHRPVLSADHRLVPLHWVGMTSAGLNVFCAVLNVMRGMSFIQHGHLDDEDVGAYSYGATFLLISCLYIYQVYLMFYAVRWRRLQTLLLLLLHIFCTFHVGAFRDTLQTVFYLSAVFLAMFVILSRQQTEQLPSYAA